MAEHAEYEMCTLNCTRENGTTACVYFQETRASKDYCDYSYVPPSTYFCLFLLSHVTNFENTPTD